MVPAKGVRGEDQRNQVQSCLQVQVVLEARKVEGKGAEAQVAQTYRVHLVTLANWKRQFLEHGAKVFGGQKR